MGKIKSIIKKPSAWLPIALSLTSLVFLLGYVAMFGVVHSEDEGAPARLFQLLMFIQIPIIAFFLIKWLPRAPKQSTIIIILQILAALLPIVTILFLEM